MSMSEQIFLLDKQQSVRNLPDGSTPDGVVVCREREHGRLLSDRTGVALRCGKCDYAVAAPMLGN